MDRGGERANKKAGEAEYKGAEYIRFIKKYLNLYHVQIEKQISMKAQYQGLGASPSIQSHNIPTKGSFSTPLRNDLKGPKMI